MPGAALVIENVYRYVHITAFFLKEKVKLSP